MGGNRADAEGGPLQPGAQQAPVTKLGSSELLMSILSLIQQDMPNAPLPPREAGGDRPHPC